MREIRTSGSTRGGGVCVPSYSTGSERRALFSEPRPSGSGSHRCINRVPPSSMEYRMALRATKGHENRGRGRYAC
jgi:hypothetical protein